MGSYDGIPAPWDGSVQQQGALKMDAERGRICPSNHDMQYDPSPMLPLAPLSFGHTQLIRRLTPKSNSLPQLIYCFHILKLLARVPSFFGPMQLVRRMTPKSKSATAPSQKSRAHSRWVFETRQEWQG
eukprot:1159363-Pelagomonas_calceolata.AAC.6